MRLILDLARVLLIWVVVVIPIATLIFKVSSCVMQNPNW